MRSNPGDYASGTAFAGGDGMKLTWGAYMNPFFRRHRNRIGGAAVVAAVTAALWPRESLPPPRFELLLSAPARPESWPPLSTLHEAWHVALPSVPYRAET